MGPCYARGLAQTLHRGEDYVLQIDSHMRFRRNWDEYLIQQCNSIKEQTSNKKVMLTTYPVGYTLPNNIPKDETRGTYLVPWKFDDNGMLRQRGRLLKDKEDTGGDDHGNSTTAPVSLDKHYLFAGGFNFAPAAQVLQDVPYDTMGLPHLFFGEELSMAVRLFTHGYDLYAPKETVAYHLWSRSHRPPPSPSQIVASSSSGGRDDGEAEQAKTRRLKANNSRDKVVRQLLGDASTIGAPYGLGNERNAEDFASHLGVDFINRKFTREDYEDGELTRNDFVAESLQASTDSSSLFPEDSLEAKVASLDSKIASKIAFFLNGI
ncbi:MAG: hypothetical protein SGARI_005588 [Bacillariaceae sp.]